jgi:hypothetical protein
LIFLISPESVTKGRYTLTGLAFARDRWRSPRDRLLSVLVVPTTIASMPNYLKVVPAATPFADCEAIFGLSAQVPSALGQYSGHPSTGKPIILGLAL